MAPARGAESIALLPWRAPPPSPSSSSAAAFGDRDDARWRAEVALAVAGARCQSRRGVVGVVGARAIVACIAAMCVMCAVCAASGGVGGARARVGAALGMGAEASGETRTSTSEAPTSAVVSLASRGARLDDANALHDDAMEASLNIASAEAVKVADDVMKRMRKDLRTFVGTETRGAADGAAEVLKMISSDSRGANVAMNARGWFMARTMRDRESDDWYERAPVDPRETNEKLKLVDDGDLKSSPAKREAQMFNACPSLVYVGAEHASEDWSTLVRQLGFAHGLRGATESAQETFDLLRDNPKGPNFVLASDVPSYASLLDSFRTLKANDGKNLDKSPSVFLIAGIQDPLIRAIESYLQYGVTQRGWVPTLENFKDFMFGKYGADAHVDNIQFRTLAPPDLVNKAMKSEDVRSTADGASDGVSSAEIVKVLDVYDLISTPKYESEGQILLKQMLYRIVGVRQLVTPPKIGYGALDRYGFAKLGAQDGARVFPKEIQDYLSSEEFKTTFAELNALDYKLYLGANARILRMWNEHRQVGNFIEWREGIRAWVLPRVEITDSYRAAASLGSTGGVTAKPCAVGSEKECDRLFARHALRYLDETKKAHAAEECLFENQGCLSRQMINFGLAQYKESRRDALSLFLSAGETDLTYGTHVSAKCAEKAFEKKFATCADDSTFGSGTLGKAMIAEADVIYLICAGKSCESLCVPKMWADKAKVLNGVSIDACLGISGSVSHFRRATLSHGAAIAHAEQQRVAYAAVVEFDATFVDPDMREFPNYDTQRALKKVSHLMKSSSETGADKFTILRLGYRAWEFENGSDTCPHGCGCRHAPDDVDRSSCMVNRAQCDLRGSHAYILSRDSFSLFLEPVLSKASTNRVIDFNIFQRFPQQVILTPMLAVQSRTSAGSDHVSPVQQMRDANAYHQACGVA